MQYNRGVNLIPNKNARRLRKAGEEAVEEAVEVEWGRACEHAKSGEYRVGTFDEL